MGSDVVSNFEGVFGDNVLSEIKHVLDNAVMPREIHFVPFKSFVCEVLSHDICNLHLKRNIVSVWQYFARKWREYSKFINSTPLYVGSYAEGMPNSKDVDILYISTNYLIYDASEAKLSDMSSEKIIHLPYTTDGCHPGYVRLILPAIVRSKYNFRKQDMVKDGRHYFMKNSGFLLMMKSWNAEGFNNPVHGPALTQELETPLDVVHAIPLAGWPSFADDFFKRCRIQYISSDDVKTQQVCVVATGYGSEASSATEWRLSFTVAEKFIIYSWNDTQMNCYYLLKNFKNLHFKEQDVVCSYYLKTMIFWMSDVIPEEFWNRGNLLVLFVMALNLLQHFLFKCFIPNYFVPENNMIGHKEREECHKLAVRIVDVLASENINVVIGETLCESKMENILRVTSANVARPVVRSCRLGITLRKYLETSYPLTKQIIINEAGHLSSLSLVMAIWNRRQCKAMETTCSNLSDTVSENLVRPFQTILNRKIADSYHTLGLRKDVSKACRLYSNNLELIYPSGFDDMLFSGVVQLSFFCYLNDDKKSALLRLECYIPSILEILKNETVNCYISICLPVYKVQRLWRDQILYSLVKDLEPERPLHVNVVVLALYIILRCKYSCPEKLTDKDKSSVYDILYLYASFQNYLYPMMTFKSYVLLYKHLIPVLKQTLGYFLTDMDIPKIIE